MENFEALKEQTSQAELENGDAVFEEEFSEQSISEAEDNPLGVGEETQDERYTVKYNGKEERLTLEELKTNAQKGMNYDHVKGEYEKLKNSPVMKVLDSLAGERNMSRSEFVLSLAGEREKNRTAELVGLGISEAEAKKIAGLEESERARIAESESERPYMEFARRFPEVKPEEIDQSVWDEFEKTNDLTAAYINFENRSLKNRLEMLEKNKENESRAVGSAAGSAAVFHDAFLEGLLG